MPPKEARIPLAYFLTFTCYGTWLHGAKEISVDRDNNIPGTEFIPKNPAREHCVKKQMQQPPYLLDHTKRQIVLSAIQEVCAHRQWVLSAAHVRTNHVHVVMTAVESAESVMNTIKVNASRRLKEIDDRIKRWTRHGSTRYLWSEENIEAAIQYVVYEQGTAMAVYENKERIYDIDL